MSNKTCCVTGHRDIPADKTDFVRVQLQKEISLAIKDGYTIFISGFAKGVDLLFAEGVAEEKKKHPELFLEAALPYRNRIKSNDKQFQNLMKHCNGIKIVCEEYKPDCFMLRNRYMVLQSNQVIAVYDGRPKGGTVFTMCHAHAMERDLRIIEI